MTPADPDDVQDEEDALGALLDLLDDVVAVLEQLARSALHNQASAVIGVDHATVTRDLAAGANAPIEGEKTNGIGNVGANAPLDIISGLAADDEMRREAERQDKKHAAIEETRAKRDASRNATARPNGYELRIGAGRPGAGVDRSRRHRGFGTRGVRLNCVAMRATDNWTKGCNHNSESVAIA